MAHVDFRKIDPPATHIKGVGDPEDFAAFHRRTFPFVWNVLGRAGILEVAERLDAAQEVYVLAAGKREKRRPEVPEMTWLALIARRVAKAHRTYRRRKEDLMDDPQSVDEAVARGPNSEQRVINRERYHEVMNALPEDLREVFVLFEEEGLELHEIAEELDIPQGTVASRLARARDRFTAAVQRIEARENKAILPVGGWPEFAASFTEVPPPGLQEAALRMVFRALGAAGGSAAVAAATSTAGMFAAGAGTGSAVTGAVALALHLLVLRPAPPPPITEAREITNTQPVSPAASPAETPAPASAAASMTVAASPDPSGSPARQVATIHPDEPAILARAEAALARGNVEDATKALDDYARYVQRFQGGGGLAHEYRLLRTKVAKPGGSRARNRVMDVER